MFQGKVTKRDAIIALGGITMGVSGVMATQWLMKNRGSSLRKIKDLFEKSNNVSREINLTNNKE